MRINHSAAGAAYIHEYDIHEQRALFDSPNIVSVLDSKEEIEIFCSRVRNEEIL